jgi:hypothetical protein
VPAPDRHLASRSGDPPKNAAKLNGGGGERQARCCELGVGLDVAVKPGRSVPPLWRCDQLRRILRSRHRPGRPPRRATPAHRPHASRLPVGSDRPKRDPARARDESVPAVRHCEPIQADLVRVVLAPDLINGCAGSDQVNRLVGTTPGSRPDVINSRVETDRSRLRPVDRYRVTRRERERAREEFSRQLEHSRDHCSSLKHGTDDRTDGARRLPGGVPIGPQKPGWLR